MQGPLLVILDVAKAIGQQRPVGEDLWLTPRPNRERRSKGPSKEDCRSVWQAGGLSEGQASAYHKRRLEGGHMTSNNWASIRLSAKAHEPGLGIGRRPKMSLEG
jgi:hypothetical protein